MITKMDFKELKIEKGRRKQPIREGSQTPQDCAGSRAQNERDTGVLPRLGLVTFPLSTPRVSVLLLRE